MAAKRAWRACGIVSVSFATFLSSAVIHAVGQSVWKAKVSGVFRM